MKILFIGSVIFSKIILKHLIEKNIKIIGIVSLKDNNKSKFKSDYYDLKKISKRYKINNLETSSINSKQAINWIKKIEPDIILSIGWSQILSYQILSIPKLGTVGYHPSMLPKNRGKHPIIWTLALGLNETGSTIFLMDKKIDNGRVISQEKIKISQSDTATSLYLKLANCAKKQIINFVKHINKKNKFTFIKSKNYKINYWRSRNFKDGEINWSSNAIIINNLVRALSYPYPNAHFYYKGKMIKVLRTKLGKNTDKNIEFGKIISVKKNLYEIKCGVSSIYLLETNPKIKMRMGEYI